MYYFKHNRSGTRIYYSADGQILDLMRVDHADAEHPAKYAGAQPLPPESLEPSAIYARRRQAVEEGSTATTWDALAAQVYERRRRALEGD